MKIWIDSNKRYKITLLDGVVIEGVTVFYRTPNTSDSLPIVLRIDGREIQVNPSGILKIEEIE